MCLYVNIRKSVCEKNQMSDEEDTGRSTRSSRAKKGAASLKTLQMLKQARTGEKKRTQQFEV